MASDRTLDTNFQDGDILWAGSNDDTGSLNGITDQINNNTTQIAAGFEKIGSYEYDAPVNTSNALTFDGNGGTEGTDLSVGSCTIGPGSVTGSTIFIHAQYLHLIKDGGNNFFSALTDLSSNGSLWNMRADFYLDGTRVNGDFDDQGMKAAIDVNNTRYLYEKFIPVQLTGTQISNGFTITSTTRQDHRPTSNGFIGSLDTTGADGLSGSPFVVIGQSDKA